MCLPGGKIRTLRKHSAQYPFKLPRYTFTSHELIMPLDQGVMIYKKKIEIILQGFPFNHMDDLQNQKHNHTTSFQGTVWC